MKIVFKKDKETNEIIAFMPYEFQNWKGYFLCYTHEGQHGQTNDEYYKNCCINAKPEEYANLKKELENIGYQVETIKKINIKEFRMAYNDFMTRYSRK